MRLVRCWSLLQLDDWHVGVSHMYQWNSVPYLAEKQWDLTLFIVVVDGCQTHRPTLAAPPTPSSPQLPVLLASQPQASAVIFFFFFKLNWSLKVCCSSNILWFCESTIYDLFSRMPQSSFCAVIPTSRGWPLVLIDLVSPLPVWFLWIQDSHSSFPR